MHKLDGMMEHFNTRFGANIASHAASSAHTLAMMQEELRHEFDTAKAGEIIDLLKSSGMVEGDELQIAKCEVIKAADLQQYNQQREAIYSLCNKIALIHNSQAQRIAAFKSALAKSLHSQSMTTLEGDVIQPFSSFVAQQSSDYVVEKLEKSFAFIKEKIEAGEIQPKPDSLSRQVEIAKGKLTAKEKEIVDEFKHKIKIIADNDYGDNGHQCVFVEDKDLELFPAEYQTLINKMEQDSGLLHGQLSSAAIKIKQLAQSYANFAEQYPTLARYGLSATVVVIKTIAGAVAGAMSGSLPGAFAVGLSAGGTALATEMKSEIAAKILEEPINAALEWLATKGAPELMKADSTLSTEDAEVIIKLAALTLSSAKDLGDGLKSLSHSLKPKFAMAGTGGVDIDGYTGTTKNANKADLYKEVHNEPSGGNVKTKTEGFTLSDNDKGLVLKIYEDGLPHYEYWTKSVDFESNKVYQRDDLIDPMRINPENGLTNLKLMQSGKAPIGPDGKRINLHHLIQTNRGGIAELTTTMHQKYHKALHIDSNKVASQIDRSAHDQWRKEYWKNRARDFANN